MKDVVEYKINDAEIAKMENLYMDLAITDLDDKEQFDSVHSARMVVKGHRVQLDKDVKAYNDQANAFKKKVKADAAPIYLRLVPIETHLQTEEDKVKKELQRIEDEKAESERFKIQSRVDALQSVGVVLPFFDVATMADDEYTLKIEEAREAYFAELERLADEEAARKAESERLEAERVENERVRKEQEALKEKIRAEQEMVQKELDTAAADLEAEKAAFAAEKKALEDAKKAEQEAEAAKLATEKQRLADQKRAIREQALKNIGIFRAGFAGETFTSDPDGFLFDAPAITWVSVTEMGDEDFSSLIETLKTQIEEFKQAAKIQAEADAKEAAELEEKERVEKEQKEKDEAARKEALRPDKDKLTSWINKIDAAVVKSPELSSDEAAEILRICTEQIGQLLTFAHNDIERM